ncbi:CoA-disulfide reductase [Fuchsiella alkaliacetigena]|uniref:CoA-disulfide reductase n=1 Tax=Fuchsiella alkaliacetigena TaxID=957042 RepID=UPI00200AC362|nr:CoA-disulfide reductase [Fuchsiella alkaliacetigena]MCK8825117.1 CoA-disulfide reductase [Fuchsiella alkaliacetigena]
MAKKVLIVGGVAGGASTAARLRRMDENVEIIIFEKGDYISFANCGLPYYIGGSIESREELLIQTPKAVQDRFNIDVRVKNEVIGIEPEEQVVKVKDYEEDKEYIEDYDFLVLSPGAEPIKPPIPGVDNERIFTLRDIPDTDQIKKHVLTNDPQKAVVVGGGFIGLEMAENLHQQGLEVAVVEMAEQVMAPLDYEMAAVVHNHLREQGIELYLENGVTAFEEEEVVLANGQSLAADLIMLSIGVKPQSELAKQAGLKIGERGGIVVNDYLQTSDENIYALGDAIEVQDYVMGNQVHIPLAGPANKQGRIVANNLTGAEEKFKGTQGTAVVKVFDLTVATTGMNEKRLQELGIDYHASFTVSPSNAGYYPGSTSMIIKTLFNTQSGQLLGAQIIGKKGVDKRIDIMATALRFGKTVFDLQELELAYAPPYSSAKSPVNMAGFVAGNIIEGTMEIIHWGQLAELDWDEAFLLDVRTKAEYHASRFESAVNIPVDELRSRLNEIPADKEIVVHCRIGVRAYIAARILMQKGWDKVRNLSGGFMIYEEVYQDQLARGLAEDLGMEIVEGREGIKPSSKEAELDLSQGLTLTLLVQERLKDLEAGGVLKVVVKEEEAKEELLDWCEDSEHQLLEVVEEDNYIIQIRK